MQLRSGKNTNTKQMNPSTKDKVATKGDKCKTASKNSLLEKDAEVTIRFMNESSSKRGYYVTVNDSIRGYLPKKLMQTGIKTKNTIVYDGYIIDYTKTGLALVTMI